MQTQTLLPYGLLGACLVTFGPASAQPGKSAVQKGWLGGLEAGQALAKKTGKPLMVVFRCEP